MRVLIVWIETENWHFIEFTGVTDEQMRQFRTWHGNMIGTADENDVEAFTDFWYTNGYHRYVERMSKDPFQGTFDAIFTMGSIT